MPPREPFPFPPLADGDVTPGPGPGDMQELLQRDVSIVRWFIEKAGWTSRGIPPASALGEFLSASEAINLHGPSKTVEEVEHEDARHLLHFSATLGRLACPRPWRWASTRSPSARATPTESWSATSTAVGRSGSAEKASPKCVIASGVRSRVTNDSPQTLDSRTLRAEEL